MNQAIHFVEIPVNRISRDKISAYFKAFCRSSRVSSAVVLSNTPTVSTVTNDNMVITCMTYKSCNVASEIERLNIYEFLENRENFF